MKRISIPLLIFCTCFVLSAWAQGGNKIITFDVPQAGKGAGQGTLPWGIVQGGWVMGNYIDANGVYHGFLRAPDGTFTTFEPPGAGKEAGQGSSEVFGMNPELEIAGDYFDANNAYHGFLRTPDGEMITFNDPEAVTGAYMGTASGSISTAGLIYGSYTDANGAWHGFLRAPDGTFTTFDPPDAGTGYYQGTYCGIFSAISPKGAIEGYYLDNNYVWHGFLRAPDGTITEFDDPDAFTGANSGAGTQPLSINSEGTIVGTYWDTNIVGHGFLRAPDGTITNFDVPGAGTAQYQGTNACWYIDCYGGIAPDGTVTGLYVDASYVFHGYLRSPDGKIIKFDAPGAGVRPGQATGGIWQGTLPAAINPEGAITGYYVDANGVYHGFVRPAEP